MLQEQITIHCNIKRDGYNEDYQEKRAGKCI